MINSFSMNHSVDQWLNETFGSNEPEHVLSLVEKIFSKPEVKEKDFWSTHQILFQKGGLSITEGFTETSDKIQIVANFILMSELSIENKREVFQHINRFFKEKNIPFQDQESSVALKEQIEGSKEKKFNIPASLYMLSDFFSNLVENEKDPTVEGNDFPFLFLPKNISFDNFQYFLDVFKKNQEPPSSILSAMQLVQIGEILDVDDYSIQHLISAIDYDSLSIEELKEAIDQWEILSKATAQQIISKAVTGYISFLAKRHLSIEQMFRKFLPGGKMMLTTPMQTPPLSLDFSQNVKLQEGDLERLATFFSSVELLNLKETHLKTLPLVWTKSLRFLTISFEMKEIPKGFINLETFDASFSQLCDISGLDESPHLRIVRLGNPILATSQLTVKRTPTGCLKLEEFYANNCRYLKDIEGLDGLPNLRIVSLKYTSVNRAPTGCLKLEEYQLSKNDSASDNNDISGLDGLPNLRIVSVHNVKKAPTGCLKLEEFYGNSSSCLNDISGLDGLPDLRIVSVNSSRIEKAPTGCLKLEEFDARDCKSLNDISGLDGSQSLRFLSMDNTLITRAPRGCSNLETFSAIDCRINNIDELENAIKLTVFRINFPFGNSEMDKILRKKWKQISNSVILRNKNKTSKLSRESN